MLTCSNCPHFTQGNLPSVGNCQLHGGKVLGHTPQCQSSLQTVYRVEGKTETLVMPGKTIEIKGKTVTVYTQSNKTQS